MNLIPNFSERYHYVENLFRTERIAMTPQLINTFTVAYQVGEPCHTLTHLLWFEGYDSNFTLIKLINLYKKWGREHGHFLRVYNKDGRDGKIYG